MSWQASVGRRQLAGGTCLHWHFAASHFFPSFFLPVLAFPACLQLDPTCPATVHLSIAWLHTLLSLSLSLHQLLAAALLSLAALLLSLAISGSPASLSPSPPPLVDAIASSEDASVSAVGSGDSEEREGVECVSGRRERDGEWGMGEVRRRVGVRGVNVQGRWEERQAVPAWGSGRDSSAWSCASTGKEALKRAMRLVSGQEREKGKERAGPHGGGARSKGGFPARHQEGRNSVLKPTCSRVAALPVGTFLLVLCGVLLFVLLSTLLPSPLSCQLATDHPATDYPTAGSPSIVPLLLRLSSLFTSLPCIAISAAVVAIAAVTVASLIKLLLRIILRLLFLPLLAASATALSSLFGTLSSLSPLAAILSRPPRAFRPFNHIAVQGGGHANGNMMMVRLLSLSSALLMLSLTFLSPTIPLLIVALQLLLTSSSHQEVTRWVRSTAMGGIFLMTAPMTSLMHETTVWVRLQPGSSSCIVGS